MSITVDKLYDESEDIGISEGSADLGFVVMGTTSGLAARQALYAYLMAQGIDKKYHGLTLMNVSLKRQPAADGIFFANAKYNSILNKIKFSLDGSAEKAKKTRSKETIGNYRVRDVANLGWLGPDFGGLVNVSKDKVDGTEVYVPGAFKLTMQWSAKYEDVRADYIWTALGMQATVNNADILLNYKGQSLLFDRGTLLFVGPVFDETANDGADITLKFEGSLTDAVTIGEIDGTSSTTWSTTGDTTVNSAVITGIPEGDDDLDTLRIGMGVTGTGIPAGSIVTAINSSTSITINQLCTATGNDVAIGFFLTGIPKEGWHYLWVRTKKVKDAATGVEVEQPDSAHVERFYDYSDFTKLEVFDRIDGFDEELQNELEAEQAVEEA